MGTSLSWLAVKGKPVDDVRNLLKVRPTGETDPLPEAELSDIVLANGWHLTLWFRSTDLCEHELLSRVSLNAEGVGCFFEEHVMFSTASHWANGNCLWSATADSEIQKFESERVDPVLLQRLHTELLSNAVEFGEDPNEVFVGYEIPLALAKSVTGFAFDEVRDDEDSNPFRVLESKPVKPADVAGISTTKAPWWKRLLGRS